VAATCYHAPSELRARLERRHGPGTELLVGIYKAGVGTPEITYSEALDDALCIGWIDGLRRSVDEAHPHDPLLAAYTDALAALRRAPKANRFYDEHAVPFWRAAARR
jgi:hypothetical protein